MASKEARGEDDMACKLTPKDCAAIATLRNNSPHPSTKELCILLFIALAQIDNLGLIITREPSPHFHLGFNGLVPFQI